MLKLEDGLTLYHGSYIEVREINLAKCSSGKDFGRGFYLTTDYSQAKSFVALSARKYKANTGEDVRGGFVSAFTVKDPYNLRFHAFDDAGVDWLHFVAANRRDDIFCDLINMFADYDVIAGKIANDQTARTLQLYMSEAFGVPGTELADGLTIAALMPNRLSDQYCFRTLAAARCLTFEGSDYIV